MVLNRKHLPTKEEMIKAFQATGAFFLLLGIIALLDDVLVYMPLYIKSIILFMLGIGIIALSNIFKSGERND